MQNKKMGAGQLGLGDNILSTICGTFFGKYQMSSLIQVICHICSNMDPTTS